jgi:hypothetical protein
MASISSGRPPIDSWRLILTSAGLAARFSVIGFGFFGVFYAMKS